MAPYVVVVSHDTEFPINTILAWIMNNYHEHGNIIITTLLLPLGHITNSLPLALESIISNYMVINLTPIEF